MENINFRGIPTSLFLNGPKLGIVTDPQSQTDVIGVATFTGIATATYNSIMYSNDLTSPGALKTKTDGFNGTLSGRSEGVGGLTFTPIPPISYSSSVEVYDNNNVTKGRINGGSYVQHATDSFVTIASGSGIITTMDFLRTDGGGVDAGFVAIRVDGNILKDADTNFALDGGSVAFNWYFDGSQILDTAEDSNSNASIVGFSSATGAGSTITINGLTTDDNNKEVYFTADYIPSAYSQPAGSAVTAGTARSTGNAFNEPLQSGIGTITVSPIIEITSQPTDQIVGQTFEAEYSIAAKTTPGDEPVNYQWQLNGIDLSDGTTTTTVTTGIVGQIEVTNDANSDVVIIDFSRLSSYDSFAAGVTYNLTANTDITTKLFATGAGGGSSRGRSVSGGAGGSSEGTFTFVKDQAYKLRIGGAGANAGAGGFSGGGNGGGGHGNGGGGGGFTGLFSESITIGSAVIIAAGGGGGANDPATGGFGGGLTGNAGENGPGPRGGGGGTQSSGGSGGSGGGGALQGGPGAAGGGGGYYGGAGGNPFSGCCADGAGGGGSGYIGGVTDGTTTTGAGAEAQQDGTFRIQFTSNFAFPEGDKICVKTSNDSTGNDGNINAITDSTIGSEIYRVRTDTQEFIQVNFETVQTGVTEIKMNGGAYVHNALYNFYINDELIFSDRATVILWSDDTLSLPKSYDISSIKIEGADGYALGNLRFNGTTVIGDIGKCVLAGDKQVTTTITGSQTDNLTISSDGEGAGVIRCKVTADNVQKSPVFSRSVSYYVVGVRNVINIEQYKYSNESVIFSQNNLSNGSLSISYDTHPGNAICLYAAEQDINVEVDMYGGKGSDNGSNSGGEGGYSKIRFTMKKDQEYILTGLFPAVNAPFLYRKASVIAIVGGGGMAGVNGNGGLGGGIGVSGSDGKGRGGGHAPTAIGPGEGGQRARFGSKFDGDALTGGLVGDDHQATDVEGGDSAPCPRGIYWRNQGKSPCEDLGITKFRSPDGTVMDRSNQGTAEIDRGYKSGYNAIQTAGAGETAQSGDGGNGYSGGWGGRDGGGGGGAYGYTDGSVTVVSTTQGGSTGPARINIKLSVGNFFIDDEGRILIFSTKDNRDPRTLTKTTGVVNYGDNACIDDARWQNFLDLARDGTQDYRLTATQNNSTTKITNATTKNIHKMMNGNALTLRTSLTGWVDSNYAYTLLALAWDETSNDGMSGYGGDYSILSWSPTTAYGYGFYGSSSSSFFNPTVYGYKGGVDFWILPPGVPDF